MITNILGTELNSSGARELTQDLKSNSSKLYLPVNVFAIIPIPLKLASPRLGALGGLIKMKFCFLFIFFPRSNIDTTLTSNDLCDRKSIWYFVLLQTFCQKINNSDVCVKGIVPSYTSTDWLASICRGGYSWKNVKLINEVSQWN